MKHLALLILLLSCTPKDSTVKSVESSDPVSIETESTTEIEESNPSDLETPPEGCACIKIFRPVCAEGRTFGNDCEAQCHGHQEWTEGPCK